MMLNACRAHKAGKAGLTKVTTFSHTFPTIKFPPTNTIPKNIAGNEVTMVHDPALDAHEHAEHAEHAAHEHDPFISRVAITVAVLAVLAAVSGSLETVEGGRALGASSEAVLKQDQATDAWDEFQADSLKKNMYTIAADAGGAQAADYRKEAKSRTDKQNKDKKLATAREMERDELMVESRKHEDRHHWLTGSATLFEIGIAMSTVAIITKRRWLWGAAMAFGAGGLLLLGLTYIPSMPGSA